MASPFYYYLQPIANRMIQTIMNAAPIASSEISAILRSSGFFYIRIYDYRRYHHRRKREKRVQTKRVFKMPGQGGITGARHAASRAGITRNALEQAGRAEYAVNDHQRRRDRGEHGERYNNLLYDRFHIGRSSATRSFPP